MYNTYIQWIRMRYNFLQSNCYNTIWIYEIWINKTYSIRTGSIKDIDRIAYWTRNRVGELVNMALMEFIENIKKGDYIEGNKEALTKKGEIKELPESELKNRAARSARMGRPKKK